MAIKKVNLGLFFLGQDEADDFLEAEQTGEENDAAIDDKCDGETNHPIDIQLLAKSCNQDDCGKENENVEPITPADFQFQDVFGEQVLQKRRYGLDAETGAGRTNSLESRYHDEIQQNIDDDTCSRHEVELLQAAVGGE